MSLWLDGAPPPGPGLGGRDSADIVIVGAGFTGLWTAYYLSLLAPERSVLVLEAEHVGAGASGRNGGWCTAEMPALLANLALRRGPMAAVRFYRAGRQTLDEIEKVLATEEIDAAWRHDGAVYVARNRPQRRRLLAWQDMRQRLGIDGMTVLDGAGVRDHVDVHGAVATGYVPHCAVVNPARIAAGLADVLRGRGVAIAERTPVTGLHPGRVSIGRHTVRATTILCATEAYSGSLTGHARRVLPVMSRVIATAPIAEATWNHLGWRDRVTVADCRYQFVYCQRTADNRLVVGGRGVGYRAGAGSHEQVFDRLQASMVELFPALAGVPVTHRWTGVYGLHRDSQPAVVYDRAAGLGYAGGYGGEGIALSNLAGRTLAALVAGRHTPETKLCWVNHRARRWEPEPLRLLGVRSVAGAATWADRYEDRTGRTAPLADAVLRAVL